MRALADIKMTFFFNTFNFAYYNLPLNSVHNGFATTRTLTERAQNTSYTYFSWTTVPYLNCSFFAKLLIIMTFYRRYARVNDVGKINRHYVYYKISTDIKLLRHEWIPCLTPKLCQKTHKRGGCSFPSQWVRLSANRRSQFASEQSATRAQTPVAKWWMPISTFIYRYWINCQNSLNPLTPRLFNRRPPFNISMLPNICYEMFWLK